KWLAGLSLQDRFSLARLLTELDDELSMKLCSLLVKDPDPVVRANVALGLGEIGYRTQVHASEPHARRTLRELSRLAGDEEWLVRAAVPQAALQYGSDTVMPLVLKLTSDRIRPVRETANECYDTLRALHPYTAAKLASGEQNLFSTSLDKGAPALGRFGLPGSTRRFVLKRLAPGARFDLPLEGSRIPAKIRVGAQRIFDAEGNDLVGGGHLTIKIPDE